MTSIAVLFHENQESPEGTAIHGIADIWRESGMSVTYLRGTSRFVPADVLLVHVNLSVVPKRYLRFADRYPVVINRHITDIRKSSFSESLLQADSAWDGQVIVKSDLNYSGAPEKNSGRNWLEAKSALVRRLRAAIERRIPSAMPFTDTDDYTIFDSKADVPAAYFSSRQVVVEKFLPETAGTDYAIRMYLFLGDNGFCVRLTSPDPIIKVGNSTHIEQVEPHPSVHEWQRRYRIDYGKFDYVVRDGNAILLDINKTTGSRPERKSGNRARDRFLAEAIHQFVS